MQFRIREYIDTETRIQKVDFKWSLCTQISPSWLLELKSGVKVKFKWSFDVEF